MGTREEETALLGAQSSGKRIPSHLCKSINQITMSLGEFFPPLLPPLLVIVSAGRVGLGGPIKRG